MSGDESSGVRTLLVGIDAGCRPVLDPMFDAGLLPNLHEVFTEGVAGPLESQIPPWTASAWPSLYTGVNPGKHGIFGFLKFDGYDWDVVNRSHVRERALWDVLDRHDLTSVVVNVPVTYPPTEFDGALVPGYVAPEDPECHPEGLLADVRDHLGEYRVYPDLDSDDEAAQVAEFERLVRMRGEAFRYLADRFDPDFGFLQFQQTDSVFHERPGDTDAAQAVYRAVDDQVGKVVEACDPDTVIVASDHGMGPYSGHEFRVNEYLRDHGYVETIRGGEGMPSWDAIARNELQRGNAGKTSEPGTLERLTAAAARVGFTSQRMERILRRVGLDDVVKRVVPTDAIRAGTEQVDFPGSTAFMRSRVECGVRLNVEGRDPEGVVPLSEYGAVRDEVVTLLSEVTTPDGDPVFERVAPAEEVFHGPYVEEAVDVVTVPNGYDEYLSMALRGETFGPPSEPWNHKRDGIVAAMGAGIDPDAGVGEAHLFDVAPTVLATLGVPRSDRMDGDPLPFVEPTPTESYPEFEADEQVATADADVERRLADLGYIE